MSTVGAALTTWEEFLRLEGEEENGTHLELHDEEVVVVPPARPFQVLRQIWLARWLTAAAKGRGLGSPEYPYRPAPNLQYWIADVVDLPNEDMEAMETDDYIVDSPPLIVEVLSPSNRRSKIERQRLAAFSGGAPEFWIVDAKNRTIEVFVLGKASRLFGVGDKIPVTVPPGAHFPVAELFRD